MGDRHNGTPTREGKLYCCVVLDAYPPAGEAISARDAQNAAEVASLHFTEARDIRLQLWKQDLA